LAGSRTAPEDARAEVPAVGREAALTGSAGRGDRVALGAGTVSATNSPSASAATAITAIPGTELACERSNMASVEKSTVQNP
jgi:hypothetical protein